MINNGYSSLQLRFLYDCPLCPCVNRAHLALYYRATVDLHQPGDSSRTLFQNLHQFNCFHCIASSRLSISVRLALFHNSVSDYHLGSHTSKRSRCTKHGLPIFYLLLLVLSGDIELNPGPVSTRSSKDMKFCHLNVASVRSKSAPLQNFLLENSIDLIALNETWLKIGRAHV